MDYYKVLGITPGADEKAIRKAFRRQALKYHPDKNSDPGAADQFRQINDALDALLSLGTVDPKSASQASYSAESHPAWAEELKKAERFRQELFNRTEVYVNANGVPHKRLTELSVLNTKLRRQRSDRPNVACRTLNDGTVFSTVKEARAYVDTHPGVQLMDSWFESEYSKTYENETLLRANSAFK